MLAPRVDAVMRARFHAMRHGRSGDHRVLNRHPRAFPRAPIHEGSLAHRMQKDTAIRLLIVDDRVEDA